MTQAELRKLIQDLHKNVDRWNRWREKHPDEQLDFTGVDVNFWEGNLRGVDFHDVNLSHGYFRAANLGRANLRGANLSGCVFYDANFSGAYLDGANLHKAEVGRAIFNECSLDGTDFSESDLSLAVFTNVDLSRAKGLDRSRFGGPLSIGVDTLFLSENQISEHFLRDAGIPETLMTYLSSLIVTPIQYNSCFISYASADDDFAHRLYADLRANNVRCWFAPENLKIGDRVRPRIDESIQIHDRLLLILSAHSIESQWVEQEVETALAKERQQGNRQVIFPIRVDNTIMHAQQGWAGYLNNTRNIGDFEQWKHHNEYQKALSRLLRDLAISMES